MLLLLLLGWRTSIPIDQLRQQVFFIFFFWFPLRIALLGTAQEALAWGGREPEKTVCSLLPNVFVIAVIHAVVRWRGGEGEGRGSGVAQCSFSGSVPLSTGTSLSVWLGNPQSSGHYLPVPRRRIRMWEREAAAETHLPPTNIPSTTRYTPHYWASIMDGVTRRFSSSLPYAAMVPGPLCLASCNGRATPRIVPINPRPLVGGRRST